jgi:hypothetical protein
MKRVETVQNRWSTDQLITGIETRDWIKLLAANRFQVDPGYLHRLLWVTGWSLPATALGWVDDARFGRQVGAVEFDPPPVFILGHWRSGTTHLHNLLARDPNHTAPNTFQVVMPTNFLSTESIVPALTSRFMHGTRTYDNVRFGWDEPAPDEVALTKLTGMSPYLAFMFPDSAAKYEKYIDFLEASEDERQTWKEQFLYFARKVIFGSGGKRLVLKSCIHSARLRMILEVLPQARFVLIHRNPYRVFRSTLHMRSHTDWENFFQRPMENYRDQRQEQTAVIGARLFERLVADKPLIPPDRLVEVSFEELTSDGLGTLHRIYEGLGLPDWEQYETTISPYLEGLKGFQKNKLDISDELKDYVYDRWRVAFDAFGYSKDSES